MPPTGRGPGRGPAREPGDLNEGVKRDAALGKPRPSAYIVLLALPWPSADAVTGRKDGWMALLQPRMATNVKSTLPVGS
jgi:hypothetical protein